MYYIAIQDDLACIGPLRNPELRPFMPKEK